MGVFDMRGLVSRFLRARGGNLATMAALVSPIFLAVAAFSVDTSSLFLERRQLQSMADFAAVAGAASLSQANDAVLRQLRANGLDPVLMTGAYDPSVVNGKTDNKTRVWVERAIISPIKVVRLRSVLSPVVPVPMRFASGWHVRAISILVRHSSIAPRSALPAWRPRRRKPRFGSVRDY